MVFEHLWNYFHFKNSTNGFPQLFQLYSHFAQGHIPPRIARVLRVAYLLAMTKLLSGVCPIIVGETLYRLTSHIFCFQFHDIFATHFSPHQFKVATKGSYEAIIHGIMCTLYLHPQLGCFLVGCGKCLQFGVKRGHISKKLCSRWRHYTIHPLCLSILCI